MKFAQIPNPSGAPSMAPKSGRAFYCFVVGQRVVILHAFVKKTQETPERELRIARRRMKEVQNG